MSKNALIIFVKNPELGKVKTRLAKTIGDKQALKVYLELLNHTFQVTRGVAEHRFVYYSSFIPEEDIFTKGDFTHKLQKGAGLGERMSNAFVELFDLGYEKVLIIGSDCIELETIYIKKAFECLEFRDYIIGPARDGGYYLLGMKKPDLGIFQNIAWSTATVYKQTVAYIESQKKDFHKLPPLTDVDTVDDLGKLKHLIEL